MDSGAVKGLIFDIQGHSVHDGPGTRTLVFMSGCPLRCKWCANPEGQLLHRRLVFKAQFCRNCPYRCMEACTKGAVRRSNSGATSVVFDRAACDRCDKMDCLKACYGQALQASGAWYRIDELMRLFSRDRCYWGPEGGVTLSGGEPLLQKEFIIPLLERCHDACISVCLETNAFTERTVLEAVLPLVEWLFIDIKHMNSEKHTEGTGVPNDIILGNIRWIRSKGWPGRMIIRTAIIPGYNDTAENTISTAHFLHEIGLNDINLLPFHRLGASKYKQLGITYEYAGQASLGTEALESLAHVYRREGITCYLGWDTPF